MRISMWYCIFALLFARGNGEIRVNERVAPDKQEQTEKSSGHTREVSSVALSADGKHVVTGSWDATAILWETAMGKKLQTF